MKNPYKVAINHTKCGKGKIHVTKIQTSDRYVSEDTKGRKTIITDNGATIIDTSDDGRTTTATNWNYLTSDIETEITIISEDGSTITKKRFLNKKWTNTVIKETSTGNILRYMDADGNSEWYEYRSDKSYVKYRASNDGEINQYIYDANKRLVALISM